jgi:hypothetical protein
MYIYPIRSEAFIEPEYIEFVLGVKPCEHAVHIKCFGYSPSIIRVDVMMDMTALYI